MKTLALFLFILSGTIGMTQITITQSDFAQGGDTAMVSISDETSLDLVTTGADVTWDFSNINIYYQITDTFHDISSADFVYQAVFNNGFTNADYESDWYKPWDAPGLDQLGNFGIQIQDLNQFTAVLSDKVQNTGVGFKIQGNDVPAEMDTIDVQFELPMNYSDTWSNTSFIEVDMNPFFDAIYRRYQWRDAEVDGWGTIITPWGSFDAIRVRTEFDAIDSAYAGQFGTWFELSTPELVEYHWFTNNQKMPIFSVITDDSGGSETIVDIRFKDKFRNIVSIDEDEIDVNMYPNPASDQLVVQTKDPIDQIEVHDLAGKLVFKDTPASNNYEMNISEWGEGVYILTIYAGDGISSKKFVKK